MHSKISSIRRSRRNHYKARSSSLLRLCVFRSGCHFYAQLIDDSIGDTIYSASTLSKEFQFGDGKTARSMNGDKVGAFGDFFNDGIPEKLKGKRVVFDRSCYAYHGLVKIFSEKARKYLNF